MIEAVLVDPRDIGWELDQPAYRVHLRTQNASAEYELGGPGIGVAEVLAWAEQQRVDTGADRADVFVVVDHAGSRGAVLVTPPR